MLQNKLVLTTGGARSQVPTTVLTRVDSFICTLHIAKHNSAFDPEASVIFLSAFERTHLSFLVLVSAAVGRGPYAFRNSQDNDDSAATSRSRSAGRRLIQITKGLRGRGGGKMRAGQKRRGGGKA